MRKISLPNLKAQNVLKQADGCAAAQNAKRNRWVSTPELGEKELDSNEKLFWSTLESIVRQTKNLEKVIKGTYKPKTEFCDISSILSLQLEKLRSTELKSWIDEAFKGIRANNTE